MFTSWNFKEVRRLIWDKKIQILASWCAGRLLLKSQSICTFISNSKNLTTLKVQSCNFPTIFENHPSKHKHCGMYSTTKSFLKQKISLCGLSHDKTLDYFKSRCLILSSTLKSGTCLTRSRHACHADTRCAPANRASVPEWLYCSCSNYDIIQKVPAAAALPLFSRPGMSERLSLCATDCGKCTLGVKKWLSPGKNALITLSKWLAENFSNWIQMKEFERALRFAGVGTSRRVGIYFKDLL